MSKTQDTLDLWCSAPGIQFKDAEAEEGYKKRTKRIADVIQLKVPDRVPIVPSFGFFPAIDNGYTCEEVMFDYDKAHQAWMKTLSDFEPDLFVGSGYALSGPALEALTISNYGFQGAALTPGTSFSLWKESTSQPRSSTMPSSTIHLTSC